MFQTHQFKNKKILIGVTGGIAAYKAIELLRYLVTNEAEVRVVMTNGAERFISKLTFETLSYHPVETEMFPESGFSGTHHIHRADWAEAAIIAPATYNFIGKLWGGIADDLLTTTVAALRCPVVLAPAMNVHMWENPVLQRNLSDLRKMNYLICPPEEGFLAEGYSGKGRLAPLEHMVQYAYRAIHGLKQDLTGRKVLISAGRTEEPIDPVRMLTNRSSGKMGFALAWEAFARGAEVTLVTGPNELAKAVDIKTIPVHSAAEMFEAVKTNLRDADIFVSAAAVADYTPAQFSSKKIKKTEGDLALPLKRTADILGYAGQHKKKNQLLVGFAVETDQPEKNAKAKLESKNLDMIALNNPLEKDSGFRTDTNKVTLFSSIGGKKVLPVLPKLDVAAEIFDFLLQKE